MSNKYLAIERKKAQQAAREAKNAMIAIYLACVAAINDNLDPLNQVNEQLIAAGLEPISRDDVPKLIATYSEYLIGLTAA